MVTWRSFMKCLPCKRMKSTSIKLHEQLPERPCYAFITGQAATSLDYGSPASPQSTESSSEEGAAEPTMESTTPARARCEIARLPEDLLSETLARTTPRDACRAAAVTPAFTESRREEGAGESTMDSSTAPARCDIARMPEDLLSETLTLTTPRDACRAAAVSPAFRAAADADAVWSSFLPRYLPPLADGDLPAAGPQLNKKQLFMRLSDSARPLVLADGLTSMWLDRATGARCYMLSARKLGIVWGDTPQYWRWIPLTDSRFSKGAELLAVCWLEIRGKIDCKMLSQNTTYTAYMVFKMSDRSYGLDLNYPPQRAEVSNGVTKSTRRVCLHVYDNNHHRHVHLPHVEHVHEPRTRTDGWMEMEMGEFNNEQGEDGEVSISLTGRGGHWKRGLIVQGIEIRVKK